MHTSISTRGVYVGPHAFLLPCNWYENLLTECVALFYELYHHHIMSRASQKNIYIFNRGITRNDNQKVLFSFVKIIKICVFLYGVFIASKTRSPSHTNIRVVRVRSSPPSNPICTPLQYTFGMHFLPFGSCLTTSQSAVSALRFNTFRRALRCELHATL